MANDAGEVLWRPDAGRLDAEPLTRFRATMSARHGVALDGDALHAWSIEHREAFWDGLCGFAGAIMGGEGTVLGNGDEMAGARWYPQARLNFAENLLSGGRTGELAGGKAPDPASDAIIFRGEDGSTARLSWRSLGESVESVAAALASEGVGVGDHVAACLPNVPEALIAMLATSSLGAVWCSCAPDSGIEELSARFGQIEPTVLICGDGYRHAGRVHDSRATASALVERLASIRRLVVLGFVGREERGARLDGRAIAVARDWEEWCARAPTRKLKFARLPFDHPLCVTFDEGTAGKPQCIVHGQGGTLLQHLKEHVLHAGVVPGDRVFLLATCGRMTWQRLVSGLAAGATVMLYDGSPFEPDAGTLYRYAADERCTHLGTSAKFLEACEQSDLSPGDAFDLGALRVLMSTGPAFPPASFDYVYARVKEDVCVASMVGGIDIVPCFALGDPTRPVHRGEVQCLGLGMAVAAFDVDGEALPTGETGELVCTRAFPGMPGGLRDDADGARHRAARLERYPGAWCHGDRVALTGHGGLVVHDAPDGAGARPELDS